MNFHPFSHCKLSWRVSVKEKKELGTSQVIWHLSLWVAGLNGGVLDVWSKPFSPLTGCELGVSSWLYGIMLGVGFMTRVLQPFHLFLMWYFLGHLISFSISLRENCSMCSYIFHRPERGGKLRSPLGHYPGDSLSACPLTLTLQGVILC